MNTNLQNTSASVLDYFALPSCSDDAADRAYQRYCDQGFSPARDFADWLEAEAWSQTAPGVPVVSGL